MKLNLRLLAPVAILLTISLTALYSLNPSFFTQQLTALLIALVAFFIFSRLDPAVFTGFSRAIYITMVAMLLLLMLVGPDVRGSVRWFDIFGVRVQVSEVIKPFFILFMAHHIGTQYSKSLLNFVYAIIPSIPIILLILIQPDLGSAIIFAGVTAFMVFMFAFPLKYIFATAAVILSPLPFVYNFILHEYQKQRITAFFNATEDPSGISYNSIQALISVGSGKLTGKGFGDSTQSILEFLPERHTDFIFASISESLGFVGAVLVLILYIYFLVTLVRLAQREESQVWKLALYGFFSLFLIHITFNIGMNLALLPVVGITLPFVSYGGSALLTSFIILGIITAITQHKKSLYSLEIN